ncbi:MAG: hypothetical protein ACRCSB_03030 [Bacteroidales bacterium]
MNANTWSYLRNPFESVTKNSFRLMIIMGKDHLDKLNGNIGDPEVANIYSFVKPAYDTFMQAFNNVQLNNSAYRSKTMQMEQLLTELSGKKIKQWDIGIQGQYLDDTVEYMDILPNNRTPFQKGAYDERVNTVSILAQKLLAYPSLATVQADVQVFFDMLTTVRTKQQGHEYQDAQLRKLVEMSRQSLAIAMHKSFAYLLFKYVEDVRMVESYFELQYLRVSANATQAITYQSFTVPANGKVVAFANKAVTGKFLFIKNNGLDILSFFVSNDITAVSSLSELSLQSGEKEDNLPIELLAEDISTMGNLILVNRTGVDLVCEAALI